MHLCTNNCGNYIAIMIKFSTDQFYVQGNHSAKFDQNRITFDPSPHIKFPLEINVYTYKWLKNIGIVMKYGVNVCFVNLNHIAKFGYGRFIITPRSKIGLLKKILLASIIGLKIL